MPSFNRNLQKTTYKAAAQFLQSRAEFNFSNAAHFTQQSFRWHAFLIIIIIIVTIFTAQNPTAAATITHFLRRIRHGHFN